MTKVNDAMKKADDAIEYAGVAQQMAGNAMIAATAQGIIFDTLIGVLRDSGFIPQDAVERVFLGAAAVIDDGIPTNEVERLSGEGMRTVVEQVASGFGVKIPPRGQTGIPRKH